VIIPRQCLAVRQPWAWAIVYGGKDLENRDWKRWKADWRFRGRVAILASAGMTKAEYVDGYACMLDIGVTCPPPHELIRGAIIGHVEVTGNVWQSDSPWFFGPGALTLRDPVPVLPIPALGQLGFFEWNLSHRPLAAPAKWMLPEPERLL
jgi:hypothetical protein